MRRCIFIFTFIIIAAYVNAQVNAEALSSLKIKEDSLSYYAKRMIFDSIAENRFYYDSIL